MKGGGVVRSFLISFCARVLYHFCNCAEERRGDGGGLGVAASCSSPHICYHFVRQ